MCAAPCSSQQPSLAAYLLARRYGVVLQPERFLTVCVKCGGAIEEVLDPVDVKAAIEEKKLPESITRLYACDGCWQYVRERHFKTGDARAKRAYLFSKLDRYSRSTRSHSRAHPAQNDLGRSAQTNTPTKTRRTRCRFSQRLLCSWPEVCLFGHPINPSVCGV